MNFQFFATLKAVIKSGSFAAAASEMNLSPSAVSLQMKRLEEYFGQILFDRSALQVKPTPFAHEVAAVVTQTLHTLEAMRRKSSTVVQGDVTIGVIDSMQALILPDAMRYLKQHYPALNVKPVRETSQNLINWLKEGEIHAAIVAVVPDKRARGLKWQLLFNEEMVLIAPPEASGTTLAELLKTYEFIHFARDTQLGISIVKYLSRSKTTVRGNIELQSTLAIIGMVSAGLGVSIMFWPDRRLWVGFPVKALKLGADAPTLAVSMVSRKTDEDSRSLAAIREAFEYAAQQAALRNLPPAD